MQQYSELGKQPHFNKKLRSFETDYQDSEDRNQKWAMDHMHNSQAGNLSPRSVPFMVNGARAIQGRIITEMLRCALWAGSAPHDRGSPVADAAATQHAWHPWEADNKINPGSAIAVNLHLETGFSYILKTNLSNMRKNNSAWQLEVTWQLKKRLARILLLSWLKEMREN